MFFFKRNKTQGQKEDKGSHEHLSFALREVFFKGAEVQSKMEYRADQEDPAAILLGPGGHQAIADRPRVDLGEKAPIEFYPQHRNE